jgi:serine/threonine-protein kinase RsbT
VREVDVVAARPCCGELADAIGFSIIDKCCLTISVSALATNILVHAGSGMIHVRQVVGGPGGCRGTEIVASDQGRGIESVELALQDGYCTGEVLGCGLPGVGRLMSELHISTAVGSGTTVRAVKWLQQPRRLPTRRAAFEWAVEPEHNQAKTP